MKIQGIRGTNLRVSAEKSEKTIPSRFATQQIRRRREAFICSTFGAILMAALLPRPDVAIAQCRPLTCDVPLSDTIETSNES
jgi:hypothetical protein